MKFKSLNLDKRILSTLESLSYNEMTPVQSESIPFILDKKDIIAKAKTGSGKTAAFGIGILQNINLNKLKAQALILCPTRELAEQVSNEIRMLARQIQNVKVITLCGGMPMGPQIKAVKHNAHIIIGTPGRIEDHLRKKRFHLDDLTMFILDEADRMLDMGFSEVLTKITSYVPQHRQTLLFSATYPDKIELLSKKLMNNPEFVSIESNPSNNLIEQHFFNIQKMNRPDALEIILKKFIPSSVLIFCTTKIDAREIERDLNKKGFRAIALHGDLNQKQRIQTLVQFENNSVPILVATDIASRGLDINDLEMVINYHLTSDCEVYVHRIGRTGRSGKKGIACSLYSSREQEKINRLEEYTQRQINTEVLTENEVNTKDKNRIIWSTFEIYAGKKQKVRAGDILGALTVNKEIKGADIGKIHIFDMYSYVAVQEKHIYAVKKILNGGKIKRRSYRYKVL